jgi:dipeptidyl aminopeptidase/acylaminoacyl peptidase
MLLSLLFFFAQSAATIADAPPTLESYLGLKRITVVEASADGRSVAFVVHGADSGSDDYRSTLYVWERRAGAQPIASAFHDVRSPKWSPDGEWLVFVATNPAAPGDGSRDQLWALPRFSDEPLHLSEITGRVIDFGWAPDGTLLILVESEQGEARGFWRLQIREGEAEQLWESDPGIRDMAVSPDGRMIAYSSNGRATPDNFLNYDIWLLDIEGASTRRLTTRAGPEVAPVWTPDGSGIVFRAPQSTQSLHSQIELFRVSDTGGAPQMLTGAFDRSVIEHRWPSEGDLLFTAAIGTYTHVFELQMSGAIEQVLGGAYNFGPFDARGVGTTISALNADVGFWRPGRQSVIQWTAPDGLAIEGILVFPADFTEGDRYPLLVNPSRGQGMRARNVLAAVQGYQPFSAQGYAVLTANVRGSIGYGESFLTARRNDLAGGELADLMTGVDYVIELGIADSTRVAVFGNDFAGYTATRAITRTQRFKASIASFNAAPPTSASRDGSDLAVILSADAGLEGFGYEDSPLRNTERVRTPLLVIDAADASSILADRARQMYRSLTDLGREAAYLDLIDAADSDPGPLLYADIFFRQLRWFDRYLKFAGADIYDFYLVGEWVSGPNNWQMSVRSAFAGASYSGIEPPEGRYLEVALVFRLDPDARRPGALEFDPTAAVSLVDANGGQLRPAGTVARLIGSEILVNDSTTVVSVPSPQAASAVSVRLAFQVPDPAAEYRLRIAGFAPVRIWIPGER